MTPRTAAFSGTRFSGTGLSGTGTLACALSLALGLSFTSRAQSQQSQQSQQTSPSKIHFEDIAHSAGLHFTHNNAASGKKYLPETMGSGVAFLDYDNDGWQDILLVNGEDWPTPSPTPNQSPNSKKHHSTLALYHNNHDGTFTDVTQKAGLAVEMMGMGVAIGDYDNDGFDDIFITALGQSRLFHNNGNGTFTDVTQKAGLAAGPHEFSTAAAWVDYDRDGRLDLFVGNYVQWSPGNRYLLHPRRQSEILLHARILQRRFRPPLSSQSRQWHLRRRHAIKAGLFDTSSKKPRHRGSSTPTRTAGPIFFISNDTQTSNKLYMNNANGTFHRKSRTFRASHIAKKESPAPEWASPPPITTAPASTPAFHRHQFSNQMLAFYHNERNGRLFVDEAPHSEVGRASALLTLGFGCFFFDDDLRRLARHLHRR